jgi:hypothetical protein
MAWLLVASILPGCDGKEAESTAMPPEVKVGDVIVGADRHFYGSHDYNGLQSVAGLLPIKNGTLLIYLFRISTDQVGGFGSSVKHPIARGLMGPYVEELFEGLRLQADKN